MKETYTMVYLCINCSWKVPEEIPLGQPAPNAPQTVKVCPYCGCKYFSHPFHPNDKRLK